MKSTIINIAELRKKSIAELADIKSVLDDFGLCYWLDFGTLLGAVRNGRSILWDGDFDLTTTMRNIYGKDGIWGALQEKGYDVQLTENKARISRKKWYVGQCLTDLKILDVNTSGDIKYSAGVENTWYIGRWIRRLRDATYSTLPEGNRLWLDRLLRFGEICRLLMSEGVKPNELECLGQIHCSYGIRHRLVTIEMECSSLSVRHYFGRDDSKWFQLILALFHRLPIRIVRQFWKSCSWLYDWMPSEPTRKCNFPASFFKELHVVTFHGIEFCAPNPTEVYLELLYGKNWRIPQHDWGKQNYSFINPSYEKAKKHFLISELLCTDKTSKQ